MGISSVQNGPRDGERTPREKLELSDRYPILAPPQFIHNRLFQRITLRSTTNLSLGVTDPVDMR